MTRCLLGTMVLVLSLPWLACAEINPDATYTGMVRKIVIEIKRSDPAVIRKELTFQEGELLTQAQIEESRKNIHRLGLLKSMEIDAAWDAQLDGYTVTVKADDGWFLLPLPMIGSRGGERFAALMLMERNYFRQSEGIMLLGGSTKNNNWAMGSVFLQRFFAMASMTQSGLDVYEYSDGAYSAKAFDGDFVDEKPGDFGTITGRYWRDTERVALTLGGRPLPWLRPSLGFSMARVDYAEADPTAPDDAGDYNAWTLTATIGREGRADPAGQGGLVAMGRIFGLGMAGVKDSLKPLPNIETTPSLYLSAERGETWLGSDCAYTKLLATASQQTLFRDRSSLVLALKGGWGDDLPASQKLSTSQRGLLQGVYAREYRGDAISAVTASYNRAFFRNTIGLLNTEIFADAAWCRDGDQGWDQQGAGFNVAYRFWRFPLPMGGGLTYCPSNDNWQISLALGGMF